MRFDIVQGTYNARARTVSCNRLVNFYPEMHPEGKGKNVKSLVRCPGYRLAVETYTEGVSRGNYATSTGRLFQITWDRLIEIDSSEAATVRGTLLTSYGRCTFSDNGTQILICDGSNGYIYNLSTNVLTKITDADFPANPVMSIFTDGYFLVTSSGSGQFHFSASYDGTAWDALDFATAEYSADTLQGIAKTSNGTIWMIGTSSLELWQNVGTPELPWRRIAGSVKEVGCIAPYSIVSNGERVFWLGGGSNGYASVYMGSGYDVMKISNPAIEYNIKELSNIDEAFAFCYSDEGHDFYIISFGNEKTFCFDLTTGEWHERGTYNYQLGKNLRQSVNGYAFAFNKHYVGSFYDANLYEMSMSELKEGEVDIVRRIVTAHISDENRVLSFSRVTIDCEKGIGVVGGVDPQIMMRFSKDGGNTYSNEITASVGKIGEYLTRSIYRRLGASRDRVFEFVTSAAVDWNLVAMYMEVE